ncbi:MAG: sigma-E processing peptidase SpoIIGA [Clostridiales bacterium]|nr:sigma-E processing peptidase SpoIIGA [Clostridiales bacterium]
MIIYLDQYMVLNALFDGMILYIGGIGVRKKGFLKRLSYVVLAGSLLGTLLTWLDGGKRSLWWGIVQGLVILFCYAVVYQQYHPKELVVGAIKMVIAACLLAGLFYAWKERWSLHFMQMVVAGTLIWLFLPFLDALWAFYQTSRLLCQVNVLINGKTITGTGLWDTGNRLYEPVSGKPVLVAKREIFRSVFSENELEEMHQFAECGYYHPEKMSCLLFRIPYQAVGITGYLTAVKAEYVEITGSGKNQRGEQVLIALYEGNLSDTNEYQFILQNIMMPGS